MFIKSLIFILIIRLNLIQSQLNYPHCSSEIRNSQITILNTLNGKVQGSCYNLSIYYATKPTSTNNPILVWLSVPYAQAPIGQLRFKSPLPVKSWNTIDGTHFPSQCFQPAFTTDNTMSSEDCLYLNIYRPYNSFVNNQTFLPILIWIHGGGFTSGSSALYDASVLALTQNIIVVTINYRLGAFGFFYLADTDANGNQALRDQNLAIKWIYTNAATFGGDQKRITLSGQSSGSRSVGYHLLYRDSWPYFTSAIMQSGTPLTPTNVLTPVQATSITASIASAFGCKNTSSNNADVLNCLQNINATAYNSLAALLQTYPAFVLDPIVFPSLQPKELFKKNQFKKCNILIGSNNYEQLSLAPKELTNEQIQGLVYGNFSMLLATLQKRLPQYNLNNLNQIINMYVPFNKQNDPTINYYIYFVEIITDYQYRCPTNQLAEYYTFINDAYVYLFTHRPAMSILPPVNGAAHLDDIYFMFGYYLMDNSTDSNYGDRALSEQILQYWSNFVSYQMPSLTNQWLSYNEKKIIFSRNILNLNNFNSIKNNVFNAIADFKCQYWNWN